MKKRMLILTCVVFTLVLFSGAGCVTTDMLKTVETQAKMAAEKSDQALTEAKTARKIAEDCCGRADQAVSKAEKAADGAEAAAVGAEAAADRAEASADKAEAIFQKSMKK